MPRFHPGRAATGALALLFVGGIAVAIGLPRVPQIGPPPVGPAFDAFAFFSGPSLGEAVLHLPFGRRSLIEVESEGTVDGDALHLVQTIRQDGRERRREWLLRRAGPGRYAGTLTDAAGEVTAIEEGARLTIGYQDRQGLAITQTLDRLEPGRVENTLIARKAGVPVAVLRETIVS